MARIVLEAWGVNTNPLMKKFHLFVWGSIDLTLLNN